MEVDELMKNCLREAMERNPDLDYIETFEVAVETYVTVQGPIEVEDEEEFHTFVNDCVEFMFDATLGDLVGRGLVDMDGVDEEGDFVFSLTDAGKEMIRGNPDFFDP